MRFGENQKGRTFAFTTFTPFKSFTDRVYEIAVLIGAHAGWIQEKVRELKFLHYAHFTRVTPRALERAGIPATGNLRNGGFLFSSAYNGDAEVYFRGFSEDLTQQMNDLWSGTVGWVDAAPYKNLERYILRFHRNVDVHVNSYPSFTSAVRRALEVRNEVDKLYEAALAMSDDEFEREYHDTVTHIWG